MHDIKAVTIASVTGWAKKRLKNMIIGSRVFCRLAFICNAARMIVDAVGMDMLHLWAPSEERPETEPNVRAALAGKSRHELESIGVCRAPSSESDSDPQAPIILGLCTPKCRVNDQQAVTKPRGVVAYVEFTGEVDNASYGRSGTLDLR